MEILCNNPVNWPCLTLNQCLIAQVACVKLITESLSVLECITVCYVVLINNLFLICCIALVCAQIVNVTRVC